MAFTDAVAQVRAAIPESMRHVWRFPPGLEGDALAAVPAVLRELYAVSEAPRAGDLRCLPPAELGNAEDVEDDFDEWGLETGEPLRWLRFGRCAGSQLYVHAEHGAVAVVTVADIKSGRPHLRVLADGATQFFERFVFGPEYQAIMFDPAGEPVPPSLQQPWIVFLLAHGMLERAQVEAVERDWAAAHEVAEPRYPAAWSGRAPGPAEASVRAKLQRLQAVGLEHFAAVSRGWDLERLGFDPDQGAEPQSLTDATEPLWRFMRLLSGASLGTLYCYTEDLVAETTERLPKHFASLGLDPADAAHWFAVGEYQRKALLLLDRTGGAVAGLEPAPVKRLRPLGDDVFVFLDSVALGPGHGELRYSRRSRAQATAVAQWTAFLKACGVLGAASDTEGD